MLEREGYKVVLAANQEEALEAVRTMMPHLVVSDMNFSKSVTGEEGLELLRKIKILRPGLPVILITAWGNIPLAVEGIKLGAFDFVTKPWDNRLLLQRINTAISLTTDTCEGENSITETFDRCGIVGRSPLIMDVIEKVKKIASTDASVLITGENGTGKELVAQALHQNSRRSRRPFVKVNLGGISGSLFESEMFGSARGAYTGAEHNRPGRFEVADTGTIFLDEIGELDITSQVKMLRVLQEHTFERLGETKTRKVDVRVISATNADLEKMVREHTFREDLFYRINLITLHLPSLRERAEDIPLLVKHFVSTISDTASFSSEAIDLLKHLPYPGNIRELRNLVERIILLTPTDTITAKDVSEHIGPIATTTMSGGGMQLLEKNVIESAMRKCDGNVSQAANMLGITRQTLYRRLKKYEIAKDDSTE
ncbi:MAG: sigma-54 dependent transcriptional regulator, partial [Muribaculaceae bacterium]|nr:sigma-54 dependent transcriptional regulator [Muribaculaceae bacterium]